MALRASDEQAIPMCHGCHMDFHDSKVWTKELRRAWQDREIARHRALYVGIPLDDAGEEIF